MSNNMSNRRKHKVFFLLGVSVFVLFIFICLWSGFQKDTEKTTSEKTMEKIANGKVTAITGRETTITIKEIPGKTLWDVLNLLGVPVALVLLGSLLQQWQNKRAENNQREEVLQSYFDRLSTLLIDKNIIAIAKKRKSGQNLKEDEDKLLKAAKDVIQARTISVLRRLREDKEGRKSDVFQFLVETEIISALKLNINKFDFKGINLEGVNLQQANLAGVDLKGINFKLANLEGADLTGADLESSHLEGAKLVGANLTKARLQKAKLMKASFYAETQRFDESCGEWWYENGTKLTGADFTGADLTGADLAGVDFREVILSKATLTGAIFVNVREDEFDEDGYPHEDERGDFRANLENANLSDAVLEGVVLERVKLTSANLEGAKLKGANLRSACLRGATLKDADLREANLKDADLEKADLANADLEGASLNGAYFTGVDLKAIRNLTEEQWRFTSDCRLGNRSMNS